MASLRTTKEGLLGEKGGFRCNELEGRRTLRRCAVGGGRKSGGGLWRDALGGEVPLLLGWEPRWIKRRELGRQTDAVQIAPNRCGIGKRSDQAQSSATGGTAGHIEGAKTRANNAAQEIRGGPVDAASEAPGDGGTGTTWLR